MTFYSRSPYESMNAKPVPMLTRDVAHNGPLVFRWICIVKPVQLYKKSTQNAGNLMSFNGSSPCMHAYAAPASAQLSRLPRASTPWLSTEYHTATEMMMIAEARHLDLERWLAGFARTDPAFCSYTDTDTPEWARTEERRVKTDIPGARWAQAQHDHNPAAGFPDQAAWERARENERNLRKAYGTCDVIPGRNIPYLRRSVSSSN